MVLLREAGPEAVVRVGGAEGDVFDRVAIGELERSRELRNAGKLLAFVEPSNGDADAVEEGDFVCARAAGDCAVDHLTETAGKAG